jgi:hypothetical protein
MGAPLPETDYLPQNNQFSPRMREARSSTDATTDGRRVLGAAHLPVSVSTPSLSDAMVDASKKPVPRLKSDEAGPDLKTPKLGGIGKLRQARHRTTSIRVPASDRLRLNINDTQGGLRTRVVPAQTDAKSLQAQAKTNGP